MSSRERPKGGFIKETRTRLRDFIDGLQGEDGVYYFDSTYPQAAVLCGQKAGVLEKYSGSHFGLDFYPWGIRMSFTPELNLNRQAYVIASYLLKEAAMGRGDRAVAIIEEERLDILRQLKEKVPGFADLVISANTVAGSEQEEETAIQHARAASWYESLPVGLQEGLIRPQDIFTQPG